jgi:hypothetical protein
MLFARREAECLRGFHNGGWHVRVGARNGFTTDHHKSHVFWGLDLVYSRQREDALLHACDTATRDPIRFSQSLNVMSGSLSLGYTWNMLHKKTIYQRFLFDFGLRIGYPFWSSVPILGQRDYISGLGFMGFPFKSVTFEPIATFRWELFHAKYGYSKGKTRKRFKNL